VAAQQLALKNLAMHCRAYAGGLSHELNERHVRSIFSAFGYIVSSTMTLDPSTGHHKGFCFIDYEVPEAAVLAIQQMNNATIGGRYEWSYHFSFFASFLIFLYVLHIFIL
jgi:RNA recognition motif-containing protein